MTFSIPNTSCFAFRLKYTVLSFFFLLASIGVILMDLCLVLLYWLYIFGSMSKYIVLPWTINCFHILVLVVRFHLSQTLDFSSFSVEYSVMPFFLTVPSYFCYNTLSLYQSKDIVGYAPLRRLF